MKRRTILGLLVSCGLVAFAVTRPDCSSDCTVQSIRVPPGASVRSVADTLAAHALIRVKPWFRLRARLAGVDRSLKPGVYRMDEGMSTGRLLDMLARGEAVVYHLTVPEGGTLYDLARQLQEEMRLPFDSLIRAAADTAFLARLGVTGPTAEGWLLPETYDFGGFADARQVLARFIEGRLSTWDSTWDARARSAGLSRADLLALASIVEAEALHREELPTIAAVYRNRLRIGMPLQADPTIQYGYLVRDGIRRPRLYYSDYGFASPWNTYLFQGLPPGPIGNPGRAAIEATLSPAPVSYLYFVADSDGHHRFSTSYSDHQRNIRQVRKP